jgi:hypothetical protein
MDENNMVEVTTETEEMLEVLFADARASAVDKKPRDHGRTLDEIEDNITTIRKMFGIEL